MALSDPDLDYLEQQIPSLAQSALEIAYWKALASGAEVLVSGENGGIYRVHADGTRTLIKPTEAPLRVPAGTRIRIGAGRF